MIGPLALLVLAQTPSVLAPAGDGGPSGDDPDARAFVELVLDAAPVFIEQRIELAIRFGIEERLLAEQIVPLFPQRFDLPVQIVSPWSEALPSGIAPLAPATVDAAGRRTLVVDGEPAVAREIAASERAGRRFRVFEIEAPFQAASPGTLVIPAPELRYAFATRFEESFVHDRVALDRTDAAVRGEETRVLVLALPESDRPIDFTGAVGRFTIETSAEPREVAAGESFRLSITIAGEGNFGRFESPRFVELERFQRLGTIEEPGEGRRTIRCDLVPQDERADEVPALAFPYFDPAPPAGYRYARSEPIALRVLPRSPGTSPPAREDGDVATTRGTRASEGQRADRGAWIVGGLVIALIAVVAAVRRRASAA